MSAEHERYATWDAAYALGALGAAERAEYEAHLAGCDRCRTAVAELTSTTALLSLLGADDAERITGPGPDDDPLDDARTRLRAIAGRRRRTRRRAWWAGAAAAAVLLVVVAVGVLGPGFRSGTAPAPGPGPAVEVALQAPAHVSASATVAFTPKRWGTQLDLSCSYAAGAAAPGAFVLAVVSGDGTTTPLSNWSAVPGATSRVTAGTALQLSGISAVEVRDQAGTVLLRHDFVRG